MPPRIPRACRKQGCAKTTTERNGYCEDHQNLGWETHQRGKSRHQRGYGTQWDKLRACILKRDKYLCQGCLKAGRVTEAKTVDHIIAKAHGGAILRRILNWPDKPKERRVHGGFPEVDIVPNEVTALSAMNARLDAIKPVINVTVDPEPPASFLLKPKMRRWENSQWLQWVKTQPCCVCGQQADDPHHIIGHGMGGMGTKAHDLFTIPLCRIHHDELHRDPKLWEANYGNQIELLFSFLNRSLGMGHWFNVYTARGA